MRRWRADAIDDCVARNEIAPSASLASSSGNLSSRAGVLPEWEGYVFYLHEFTFQGLLGVCHVASFPPDLGSNRCAAVEGDAPLDCREGRMGRVVVTYLFERDIACACSWQPLLR